MSNKWKTLSTGIKNATIGHLNINVFFSEQMLNIIQNSSVEKLNFKLYDVSGRVLIDKLVETSSEYVNVASLSPGIYLFGIKSTNGSTKTGRLFIN